jgi:hypothetical protein
VVPGHDYTLYCLISVLHSDCLHKVLTKHTECVHSVRLPPSFLPCMGMYLLAPQQGKDEDVCCARTCCISMHQ